MTKNYALARRVAENAAQFMQSPVQYLHGAFTAARTRVTRPVPDSQPRQITAEHPLLEERLDFGRDVVFPPGVDDPAILRDILAARPERARRPEYGPKLPRYLE